MIHGVIIKKIAKYTDERGWLSEIWRIDETDFGPKMAYASITRSGVVRGPHEHKQQSDCFVFCGPGNFKLYLWENREGADKYRELETMEAGTDNPTMIIVPPGVVHGYKCISSEPAYSINLPNALYKGKDKKEEVDEIRWENDPKSPFKIK
jgi:dTDP-4-dehydrorhamnose 3,5-epimerase